MKILVTGGTGLIGHHVLMHLKEKGGAELSASYNRRSIPKEHQDIEWIQADLLDPEAAMALVSGFDAVIGCAGIVASSPVLKNDPVQPILNNLHIASNTLEAAAKAGVKRVVWVSSATGYPETVSNPICEDTFFDGQPVSNWFGLAWMTRYIESQCQWYAEKLGRIEHVVALRPSMVYGPRDDFDYESGHFVPAMIRRVVERLPQIEIWGTGEQRRDLIHAHDLARAAVCALNSTQPFGAYNVAAGESWSVNEIVSTLVDLDDFHDAEIVHVGGSTDVVSAREYSIEKIWNDFGYKPEISLRQGLHDALNWYRNNRGCGA